VKLQRDLLGEKCVINIRNTILAVAMALLGKGKSVAKMFDTGKREQIRDTYDLGKVQGTYDLYTFPRSYVSLVCSPLRVSNSFALAQQRATFAVRTTPPEPVSQAAHSQKGGVADN